MTDKSQMSDEEMLRRLSSRPQIRNRISSLLAAVDDTAGDLKLADDAELRVTQDLQRMGQEAVRAWASTQVNACEQDVRRTGRAHREGKKTLLAHHIWRHRRTRAPVPQWQQKNAPVSPKRPSHCQRLLTPARTRTDRFWC